RGPRRRRPARQPDPSPAQRADRLRDLLSRTPASPGMPGLPGLPGRRFPDQRGGLQQRAGAADVSGADGGAAAARGPELREFPAQAVAYGGLKDSQRSRSTLSSKFASRSLWAAAVASTSAWSSGAAVSPAARLVMHESAAHAI